MHTMHIPKFVTLSWEYVRHSAYEKNMHKHMHPHYEDAFSGCFGGEGVGEVGYNDVWQSDL